MVGPIQCAEFLRHRRKALARMVAQTLDGVLSRRVVGKELDRHAAGAEGDGCRGIRQFVATGRDLERAAADVEEQDLACSPAEPAADGEEGEPGLGLAAEHLQRLAQGVLDQRDHLRAVRRLAHGRGRRREQLVDALGGGHAPRLGHGVHQSRDSGRSDLAVRSEVAHQAQHRALTRRGQWSSAGPHVGDEQMDGVRTDVEDSQAHGSTVAPRRSRSARGPSSS